MYCYRYKINKKSAIGTTLPVSRLKGVSLIVLMFAIAIVSILSTVAYASYRSSITKAKRVEAKSAIFKAMQQEERFFTQNNRYANFGRESSDPNAAAFKWYSGETESKSSYELRALPCKDDEVQHCIEITAIPGTTNVDARFHDEECGSFSMTSTGHKSFSGAGNKEHCW